MQTFFSKKYLFLFAIGVLSTILIVSCSKDEKEVTVDPSKIELLSFGPSPALRGGELQFIGRNMDKVTEIVLPENVKVSNFKSKTAEKLIIVVPEETVTGLVTLKTPQGDIATKSLLTISEPIAITAISPAEARPGDKVTITGTYLNLIQEVIFADKKVVTKDKFVSQSREKLEINIPLDAKSGIVTISNGMPSPILVSSVATLVISLPAVTAIAPSPVKAGSVLTITGTNLDLVKELVFGGGKSVVEYESQSRTEMKVKVPVNAQDGTLKLLVASLLDVTSSQAVEMLVPTINDVSPNPAKPGTEVTVTGKDLDLITSITFGGGNAGEIISKTEGELKAKLPLKATAATISVGTAANKTVTTAKQLDLVVPVIASFSTSAIKSSADLGISGTNMDLVVEVWFSGGVKGANVRANADQVLVTVPPGSKEGPITLVTTNGTQIVSSDIISILVSNVPTITGYPASVKPGTMIVLTGEKLDITTNVIFPGNIAATKFGAKTANMIEVVVPDDVKRGRGVITFVTFEGESTTSPEINFQGVDAVVDPGLVFFDFNGKNAWWGNVQIVNDANSVDGTSYGKLNGSWSGWTDLFWRNGANDFPGAVIGKKVEDYVIKIDINILSPIDGGNIKMRLNGDEGDFWWAYGPAAPTGAKVVPATEGWETITIPIVDFRDNYGWGSAIPSDMSVVSKEFGMAFDNGSCNVNILIDNVRFEKIK